MVSKAQIERWKKTPKYKTRKRNVCFRCGRTRAFFRDFSLCRICLREMAHKGEIPGLKKASW
ncbi:MAG: 30S ribosomal protein S14 type Z [Candidatus Parcubacteria bacterium]|nr:MAG: 30S ribosomal protein S14 type Z [Candidatus Parcubacteria bacterium]